MRTERIRAKLRLRACILAALLNLAVAGSLPAQGLGLTRGSPAAQFKGEDWKMLNSTIHQLLEEGTVPAARSWKNEATGSHGKVTVLKAYEAPDGRDCRRLRVDSHAGGRDGSLQYSMCRDGEGTWRPDAG